MSCEFPKNVASQHISVPHLAMSHHKLPSFLPPPDKNVSEDLAGEKKTCEEVRGGLPAVNIVIAVGGSGEGILSLQS